VPSDPFKTQPLFEIDRPTVRTVSRRVAEVCSGGSSYSSSSGFSNLTTKYQRRVFSNARASRPNNHPEAISLVDVPFTPNALDCSQEVDARRPRASAVAHQVQLSRVPDNAHIASRTLGMPSNWNQQDLVRLISDSHMTF
jgi:hypothetical protein